MKIVRNLMDHVKEKLQQKMKEKDGEDPPVITEVTPVPHAHKQVPIVEESKSVVPAVRSDVRCSYAILVETNYEHDETWYYFIRYEGNEENLKYLEKHIRDIKWEECDHAAFDIDLENRVSALTAKEMTRVDVNHEMPHRKFDGTLKELKFHYKPKDKNKKKQKRVFDLIGAGSISKFIDKEDVNSDKDESSSAESDSE